MIFQTGDHTVTVKSTLDHPLSKKEAGGLYVYDVSILTLEKPIKISRKALPVALGTEQEFNTFVKQDAQCQIVGNGRAGAGGSAVYETYLQKGQQIYNTNYDCSIYLKSYDKSGFCFLTAGSDSNSGCPGDSGGPLFCAVDGKYKQFGVASFAGVQCNCKLCSTPNSRVIFV